MVISFESVAAWIVGVSFDIVLGWTVAETLQRWVAAFQVIQYCTTSH